MKKHKLKLHIRNRELRLKDDKQTTYSSGACVCGEIDQNICIGQGTKEALTSIEIRPSV